jgi:RHS repeat-associated protein
LSNETTNEKVFFDNLTIQHYTGTLTEENCYYPFGLTMSGLSSKAAGKVENKHKFNSIEQNKDFDINTYDAFYRTNDPQLGRWWQIDPKGESFFGLTPYNSMGNNPVKFNDPLGDIFDEASQVFVNGAKEAIKGRQKELSTQRANLKNQIAEAKKVGDKDAVKLLKGQLKEVNSMRSEMNAASSEISRMESDEQLFMIREFSGDNPFGNKTSGVTTYSKDDKAVVIGIQASSGYDALIHELKHGFDFLAGEMSFKIIDGFNINDPKTYFAGDGKGAGALYDKNDEVRTYKRGFSYNPGIWKTIFSGYDQITATHPYIEASVLGQTNAIGPLNIANTAVPKNEVYYKTHKN